MEASLATASPLQHGGGGDGGDDDGGGGRRLVAHPHLSEWGEYDERGHAGRHCNRRRRPNHYHSRPPSTPAHLTLPQPIRRPWTKKPAPIVRSTSFLPNGRAEKKLWEGGGKGCIYFLVQRLLPAVAQSRSHKAKRLRTVASWLPVATASAAAVTPSAQRPAANNSSAQQAALPSETLET